MAINMAYQVLEALCAWAKLEAKKPLDERTKEYQIEMSLRYDDLIAAAIKWEVPQQLMNQIRHQAPQHPYESNSETINRALSICNMGFINGELVHLSDTHATDNSNKGHTDKKALSQ